MNRRALATGLVALLVLALAWVASPDLVLSQLAWLTAKPLRFALALCLLAAVRPVLALPTTLLAVLAGYGFGIAGAPFGLLLVTLTSVPPYLLALRGRDGWDEGSASALTRRAADAGERAVSVAGDFRSVAASRLVPTPSDAVSVAAGLAGVRLRPYLLGTAVGEIPWVAAGTVAGASAERLATDGVDGVFDPWLVAVAGLAGVLLIAGPVVRRYRSVPSGS